MKKKLLRVLLFSIIFVLMFHWLNSFFKSFRVGFEDYWGLEDNTLDVLVVGTSHMQYGFNTMHLWEEYNIASFVMGTSAQPYAASYLYLLEGLKTQKPQIVVIDAFPALIQENYSDFLVKESYLYMNFDMLPNSWEKHKVLMDTLPFVELCKYYFPIFSNHDNWKTVNEKTFQTLTNIRPFAGFAPNVLQNTETVQADLPSEGTAPLGDKALQYLDGIIRVCQEEEITLLVLQAPCVTREGFSSPDWLEKNNTLKAYLMQNGVPYYDYNDLELLDAIAFNYSNDMFDNDHLNYMGNVKLMNHFGVILAEELQPKEHIPTESYTYWDEKLELYTIFLAGALEKYTDQPLIDNETVF